MNIPSHQITKISHSKLILRDDNRTVSRNEENTKLRAANIKMVGILQNIVVTKAEQEGYFYLEAGYGRYASIEILIAENATTAETFFYPAMIAEQSNLSTIIKLAENSNRDDLHPVDEFLTYQKAVSDGKKVKEIANIMGVDVKHVNQRLTLAKLSPVIINALRENIITVKAAEAFTLCNTERQELIYSGLSFHELSNHSLIKRRILEDKVNNHDPIAKFVGESAYKKAGGQITKSLFDDTTIFENADLLRAIAKEKLEQEAKEFGIDGWKWIEYFLGDAVDSPVCGKTKPLNSTGNACPAHIAQEIIENKNKLDKLYDNEEWNAEDSNAIDALESRNNQLEEDAEIYDLYDESEMRFAGCIVGISPAGTLQILKGRITTEDKIALDDSTREATESPASDNVTQPATTAPVSDSGYSQALKTDLSETRTALLQAAIAQSHDHAITLGIFSIADTLLRKNSHGYCGKGSHISLNASPLEAADAKAMQEIEKARKKLNLSWTSGNNETRFNTFAALSREEKDAIFAYCVARGIQPHLASPSVPESLAITTANVNPFYRKSWTPERDSFFKRVPVSELLEIGQTIFGGDWAEHQKDTPKKDLVNELSNAFSGKATGLPDDVKQRIAHWTPNGF